VAIVNVKCIVIDGTAPSDGTLARLPAIQPITWPIGETGSINFAVTGTDGAVYDLTDCTLAIVCRRHLDDAEPVFAIDAVNVSPAHEGDPEPGTAIATMTSDATSDMLAGVVYWYDVRLSATGGSSMQVVPLSKWTPGPVCARDGEPPPETPPS
jgi:hypothetical protein